MAAGLRVFSDASVLIAAGGSSSGGSALAAKVCMHGLVKTLVARLALWEAVRNLHAKFPPSALVEFHNLVGQLNPEVVPNPSPAEIYTAGKVVAAKDAHVLAGTHAGNATHLLTLDRRYFLDRKTHAAILPIVVCTPG
jgi:predicted nucleic acid-binding protein